MMNDLEIKKLKYGLEGLYLTVTKIIIVIIGWLLLGIIEEGLIFLTAYSLIRFFVFGVHAKNSFVCIFISLLIMVIFPFFIINVYINFISKILLFTLSMLLIIMYAPAGTKKRPIVKKEIRQKFKIKAVLMSLILFILSIVSKDLIISNLLIAAITIATLLTTPLAYKLLAVDYI